MVHYPGARARDQAWDKTSRYVQIVRFSTPSANHMDASYKRSAHNLYTCTHLIVYLLDMVVNPAEESPSAGRLEVGFHKESHLRRCGLLPRCSPPGWFE